MKHSYFWLNYIKKHLQTFSMGSVQGRYRISKGFVQGLHHDNADVHIFG